MNLRSTIDCQQTGGITFMKNLFWSFLHNGFGQKTSHYYYWFIVIWKKMAVHLVAASYSAPGLLFILQLLLSFCISSVHLICVFMNKSITFCVCINDVVKLFYILIFLIINTLWNTMCTWYNSWYNITHVLVFGMYVYCKLRKHRPLCQPTAF